MTISDSIKERFQPKLLADYLKWVAFTLLMVALLTIAILMMTAREQGHSFITIQVKIEAKISGRDPCDILAEWRIAARRDKDTQLALAIQAAEKFMGCRNEQKRGRR